MLTLKRESSKIIGENKMKSLKFNIISIIVLGLFLTSIFSTITLVRGQMGLSYLTTLQSGTSYAWEVTALSTSGPYLDRDFLDFGNDSLEMGDIFSINITQDINVITDGDVSQLLNQSISLCDFYLNGEYKTNVTDDVEIVAFIWSGHFFLQPTTYINVTGSYNSFQLMENTFLQTSYELKDEDISVNYYDYTHSIYKQSSSLNSKTWIIKMESTVDTKEDDLTDPLDWEKNERTITITSEARFDIETGFLSYLAYTYTYHDRTEVEGSIDIDSRNINFILESITLAIDAPYNWSFSIISLLFIGLVVIHRRRK